MQNTILALAALAVILTPAAILAQSPSTPPTNANINQRKTNQQERIGNGVQSGQLTPRETGHLEHQEAGINREEHAMRAQDNGHLTHQDRRTLKSQQNQESRRISRDKHNTKVR